MSTTTHYDIIIIGTGPSRGRWPISWRVGEEDPPVGAWRLSAAREG